MNISFAGCGFLGIYHLGVAACLVQNAPRFLASIKSFAGASAGSLVAAVLATSAPIKQCSQFVTEMSQEARQGPFGPMNPNFDLLGHIEKGLQVYLPEDCHERANGRLYVSLTRLRDNKNVLVSEYGSKKDLVQVLLASCFIPVYAGLDFPKFKGEKWFDGGFTDNLPIPPQGQTIVVSPFSGQSDICPRDTSRVYTELMWRKMSVAVNRDNARRSKHILYPPNLEIVDQLYQTGYKDSLYYINKNALK